MAMRFRHRPALSTPTNEVPTGDTQARRSPSRLPLTLLLVGSLLGAIAAGSLGAGKAAADESPELLPRVFLPALLRAGTLAQPERQPTALPPASVTPSPVPPTAIPTQAPATATPEPPTALPPSPTPPKGLPLALEEANRHRAIAGLGPVTENPDWSRGGELHARYMVKNDEMGHSEDPAKPFFSQEGLDAAKNGNVFVSSMAGTDSKVPVNFWMTGPFHQVAVIDPELSVSGFGEYREEGGTWAYGAVLEVGRGRVKLPADFRFPVRYPEEGQVMPNLSFGGNEWPDPLTSCPGYKAPTGAPLVLMLGPGDRKPAVEASVLVDAQGGQYPHCLLDETRYVNSNASIQSTGRAILDSRDAIVLLPRAPLKAGTSYRITIVNSGVTHSWSFSTARAAWLSAAWQALALRAGAWMGGDSDR